jgi:TonB family protein
MKMLLIMIVIAQLFCQLFVFGQDVAKSSNRSSKTTNRTPDLTALTDAEFPGGYDSLISFVQHHFEYPQRAIDEEIEGLMFVQFTILPNGSVSQVNIIKGLPECAECEEEALNVVRKMPRWTPAREGGKNVASLMNLPITMELSDEDEDLSEE